MLLPKLYNSCPRSLRLQSERARNADVCSHKSLLGFQHRTRHWTLPQRHPVPGYGPEAICPSLPRVSTHRVSTRPFIPVSTLISASMDNHIPGFGGQSYTGLCLPVLYMPIAGFMPGLLRCPRQVHCQSYRRCDPSLVRCASPQYLFFADL